MKRKNSRSTTLTKSSSKLPYYIKVAALCIFIVVVFGFLMAMFERNMKAPVQSPALPTAQVQKSQVELALEKGNAGIFSNNRVCSYQYTDLKDKYTADLESFRLEEQKDNTGKEGKLFLVGTSDSVTYPTNTTQHITDIRCAAHYLFSYSELLSRFNMQVATDVTFIKLSFTKDMTIYFAAVSTVDKEIIIYEYDRNTDRLVALKNIYADIFGETSQPIRFTLTSQFTYFTDIEDGRYAIAILFDISDIEVSTTEKPLTVPESKALAKTGLWSYYLSSGEAKQVTP